MIPTIPSTYCLEFSFRHGEGVGEAVGDWVGDCVGDWGGNSIAFLRRPMNHRKVSRKVSNADTSET